MDKSRTEILLHPVRLVLMRLLADKPMTTLEIGELMPEVPNSSIYRHLRMLLKADLIEIAEIRLVNGIQEKTYQLNPKIDFNAMNRNTHYNKEEILNLFSTYAASLIQSFSEYLDKTTSDNYYDDRAGFSKYIVYASQEEIDRFGEKLKQAIEELMGNKAGPGRRMFKIALVTHPLEIFDTEIGD
ncbi:MAG: helix-turn-helix domain-containing protein [Anaerolineaceae bacterium]|nr:helix-turn-helix domain-containing protein [Anaerolineaceae bacterium]